MVALNVVLMALVVIAIAAVLARAIISDRRSKRTSGGPLSPADAPLDRDLTMPRELRRDRGHRWQARRDKTRA